MCCRRAVLQSALRGGRIDAPGAFGGFQRTGVRNSNVFPEVFCGLYESYLADDLKKAQALQRKINVIRSILKDDIAYFKAPWQSRVWMSGFPAHPFTG